MKLVIYLFLVSVLVNLFAHSIAVAETKASAKTNQFNTTQGSNGEYVRKRFLGLMKKPFTNNDDRTEQQKKILIIGDSHAQDFLNAIIENNYLANAQIRTRYIPTRCQIYLGKNKHLKWLVADKNLCERSDNLELAKTQINQADVIILAAFWRKWAVELLPETIKNLNFRSDQSLFIIGRRSFRKIDTNNIQSLNKIELKQIRNVVDENQLQINKIMQSSLDHKIFVNAHQLLCGEGSTCPAFTDNGKLISFDGGHLSQAGARYFGRELFQKSQLRRLISK